MPYCWKSKEAVDRLFIRCLHANEYSQAISKSITWSFRPSAMKGCTSPRVPAHISTTASLGTGGLDGLVVCCAPALS